MNCCNKLSTLESEEYCWLCWRSMLFLTMLNYRKLDCTGGSIYRSAAGQVEPGKFNTIIDLRNPKEVKNPSINSINVDLSKPMVTGIFKSIPWWAWLISGFLYLYSKQWSRQFAMKFTELNNGLIGFNKATLRYSAGQIKMIMDILSEERRYPILIHCAVGKDRTGLICCLIQLLCEEDESVVVDDYSKSAALLMEIRSEIEQVLQLQGLPRYFLDSPPEVMIETIRFLSSEYGGVEAYLSSIGVDHFQQQKIKKLLTLNSSRVRDSKL
jgi:hypothetical protein